MDVSTNIWSKHQLSRRLTGVEDSSVIAVDFMNTAVAWAPMHDIGRGIDQAASFQPNCTLGATRAKTTKLILGFAYAECMMISVQVFRFSGFRIYLACPRRPEDAYD